MTTALRIRGASVQYGGHLALEDADLTLYSGTITALIGPNGSGKSTLLGLLSGLLRPSTGTVEVADGRRVAHVLQQTDGNQHLPVTVREVVRIGRYARHSLLSRLRGSDHDAVDDAIARMELTDLADRQLQELSGGQRQRALVAQGLAQEAAVLLLDEPVTGLDIPSSQLIARAMDAEAAAGRTVVFSTHSLDEASGADQVVLLRRRIVACGLPQDVLVADVLAEAYGQMVIQVERTTVLDDHAHAHDHSHPHDHAHPPRGDRG